MVTVLNTYFIFHLRAITDEHVITDRVMEHDHTYTLSTLSIKDNLVSNVMLPFNLEVEACNALAGTTSRLGMHQSHGS
jgi:hypothetical protein